MEDYEVLKLIGEGSFGRVFKARNKRLDDSTGNYVALKLIPKIGKDRREIDAIRYWFGLLWIIFVVQSLIFRAKLALEPTC